MATAQQIDQQIFTQATSMGVPADTAKLIVAQARYETFSKGLPYNSNVFKSWRNAFGYKWVGQKKWASGPGSNAPDKDAQGVPDGGTYAAYPSIAYSTGELVDWLKRREKEGKFKIANLKTPEQYATALKASGYYGQSSSLYTAGVTKMLQNVTIAVVGFGGLVLIALGVFF